MFVKLLSRIQMLFHKEEDHIRRYDDRRRGDRRGSGGGGGNGGGGDDEKGNSSKGPNRQNLMIMLLATVITLVVISYVMNRDGESATEISYNEFVQMVEQGTVEEVNVKSDRLEIHLKDSEAIRYTAITEDSTALTDRLLKAGVTINGYIPDSSGMVISFHGIYLPESRQRRTHGKCRKEYGEGVRAEGYGNHLRGRCRRRRS